MSNDLTLRFQNATLAECEAAIQKANEDEESAASIRSAAFRRIHSEELWRPGYRNFSAYVESKWGIKQSQAYAILGLPKPPRAIAPPADTCTKPVDENSGHRSFCTPESTVQEPEPEASFEDLLGPVSAKADPPEPEPEPETLPHMKRAWEQERRMERAVGEFAGAMLQLCRQFPREGWPYESWGAQLNNMVEILRRDLKRIESKSKARAAQRNGVSP